MDLKKHIKQIITEELSNLEGEKYVMWTDLSDNTQDDIIENIYNNSSYLEREWNIWTFKENIENDLEVLKFKVKYMPVDDLYEQLKNIGWRVSNKRVSSLIKILKTGKELDPVIVNGDEFFDGGHRLTAYKTLGEEKIPTIDISPLINLDWEKWMNGEIEFEKLKQ